MWDQVNPFKTASEGRHTSYHCASEGISDEDIELFLLDK